MQLKDKNVKLLLSVTLTLFVSTALTFWAIYDLAEYGIALFVLIPFLLGAMPPLILGYKHCPSLSKATKVGFLTLGMYLLGLLVFAMEGLICISMLLPLALALTWTGVYVAYLIIKKKPNSSTTTLLLIIVAIPTTAFIERNYEPSLTSVVTSIEIAASPEVVWKNVIEFPQLDEPTEFLFKTGIAYPINAKIEGTGVGAIRHCNFTTGSFLEPITVWDEPNLLKFDVVEQPEPMKELSFWDIDAPHLHDYFVSKQGQFKLTKLPNGNTLLEGTTWYYHKIKPAIYWQLWSNFIIHKIHERVLVHIKKNAENEILVGDPVFGD